MDSFSLTKSVSTMEKNLPSFKRLHESRASLEAEFSSHASAFATHRLIVKYLGPQPFPAELKTKYPHIDFFSVRAVEPISEKGIMYIAYPIPLSTCQKAKSDLSESLWREVDAVNEELRTLFGHHFTSQVAYLSEAILKWRFHAGKDLFTIRDTFKEWLPYPPSRLPEPAPEATGVTLSVDTKY